MNKQQHPRIFWLLRGSYDVPSSRIHGYRVHNYLLSIGWKSTILVQPSHWLSDTPLKVCDVKKLKGFRSGDVVIIQKLEGPRTVELVQYLSDLNVVTIYLDCDMPLKIAETSSANWVVCSSNYLMKAYKKVGINNVEHIPDAVEYFQSSERVYQNKSKLQCVWFGSNINAKQHHVDWLRNLFSHPKLSDWELITISKGDIADINWELDTIWEIISRCDAVAIPTGNSHKDYAKSENRVTQSMALMTPVIATPIPAYSSVIKNGETGFLCKSYDEWVSAFKMLTDRNFSNRMARQAYKYVEENYSMRVIGSNWCKFFERVVAHKEITIQTDSKVALEIKKLRARSFARLAESKVGKRRREYLAKALKENPYDYVLWKAAVCTVAEKIHKTFTKL